MTVLVLGILLIVAGLVLAFTNALGLAALAEPFIWIGWLAVALGIVLALVYALAGRRRDVVVEREYRRPGYP